MLHPFWHLPHQQGWNGVGQQGSQDEKSQVQVQPPPAHTAKITHLSGAKANAQAHLGAQ